MIVDRILAYLEGDGVPVTDEALALAVRRVERTLKRNLGTVEERNRARKTIGGSIPWYCPRRAYYSLTGARGERPSGRSRVAFLMGDVLQAAVDILAKQAGCEFAYPNTKGEELEIDTEVEGVRVVAHIDHALRTTREGLVVMDSKSMATYTFRDFKKACTDPHADWHNVERWGYKAQIRFYMWLVELLGLGTGERGAFIGIDKNTGHLAELWVERDEATIAMFRRAIPALAAMRDKYLVAVNTVRETALANGADEHEAEVAAHAVPRNADHGLPARPAWARTVVLTGANKRPDGSKGAVVEVDTDKERTMGNGWRCGYCPFTAECWPGFELVAMSNGPKWRKAHEG